MKRVMLVIAFVFILCIGGFANENIVFTYEVLPDGSAAITGATGLGYMCEIPKKIDGYTVSALGNGSPLKGFDEVDSVTLNENVTRIADNAFFCQKKLNNIFNMGAVKTVGNYAFYGCEKLDSFVFENLEYIGEGAFAYCKKIGGINSRVRLESIAYFDGAGYPYLLSDGSYGYNTSAEAEKAPFYGCDGIVDVEIDCSAFYLPMEIMFLDCRRITHADVYGFNSNLNVWEFMVADVSADGKIVMNYHPNAIMFTSMGDAAKEYAESKYMVYRPMYSAVKVLVDGEEVVSDQDALLMNSRTMVPLRAISEKLGAEVLWDDATKTVTVVKGVAKIQLFIGKNHMIVGKKVVYLDVAPLIFNSRTLVPLRAVSEAFDCEVNWDGDTMTVTVESLSEVLESTAKKEIVLAKDGTRYAVYYNANGKRVLVQKLTYSASGELTASEPSEEAVYDVYGNLKKKIHPDGTVERFGYDVLHELNHYEIYRSDGSFKKYDYFKWRNGYLLGKTEENGDNPEIGNRITEYSYYNGWETLQSIKDNYGTHLEFYYADEAEYQSGARGENVQGVPLDYVIVFSGDEIVEKYKGGFEKYTNVEFYNANGDKYADILAGATVIESVTVNNDSDAATSENFEGINYEKAMSTGNDPKFIPSVETMFEGENSLASEGALKAFPIRKTGEDTTLFSAATILCDTMYNLNYRDTEALASVGERMKTATDLANGNPQPIRGGVMYSFPSVFDAEKNVEKKVVSEAFFASSPENCIQLEGPMPQCLQQTIKGYLYIKYNSFDDHDFTLELGKWYRTEVEITFGYTQTPTSGVHHSVSIASLGFEKVPEELLITE